MSDIGSTCIPHHCRCTTPAGYGQMQIGGQRFYVHRLVAMIFHGLQIQDTKSIVCHKCDNPRCINPDHLYVGTQTDNMNDAVRRGRRPKPTGFTGEKNPKAKLTWEIVREIRAYYADRPKKGYEKAAARWGISPPMLSGIVRGLYWKE